MDCKQPLAPSDSRSAHNLAAPGRGQSAVRTPLTGGPTEGMIRLQFSETALSLEYDSLFGDNVTVEYIEVSDPAQ